jgi:hypothetical protein
VLIDVSAVHARNAGVPGLGGFDAEESRPNTPNGRDMADIIASAPARGADH